MCKCLVNSKAFYKMQGRASHETPQLWTLQHPSLACLDWGQKAWLHVFPASFISESTWSCFATKLHNWKPTFISSLSLLVFSLISHCTPSSDSMVFWFFVFSTLHTFPGCKRAWTMNIYQHDLWFVSRFEYQMLIFQAPRLNSSQTKTVLVQSK